MPPLGPVSRRDLVRYARQLGFDGPFSRGRHDMMVRGEHRLTLPNPHGGDISRGLLVRLLQQSGITREEWESL